MVHGDFRFGNFIISESNLESIIDWELAHIGNPMEDIGWLCVRSWRFGNVHKRVGGLGDLEELIEGYESISNIKKLVPLTGGASADINRIILENNNELIVRRSLSKEQSVMAVPKKLEAKIQRIVRSNDAPVPEIIFEFSEDEDIGEGYVMEAIPGETIPRKILRDDKYKNVRSKLSFEIGRSLATIHQTKLDELTDLDSVTFEESLKKLYLVYSSFEQPQPVFELAFKWLEACLLYTSPSPRDVKRSRMPSSA